MKRIPFILKRTPADEMALGILRSERLRVGSIAAITVSFFAYFLIMRFFFIDQVQARFGGIFPVHGFILLFLLYFVYEAGIFWFLGRLINKKHTLPGPVRYWNALVEISAPSLAIYLFSLGMPPDQALLLPTAFAYFVFIILSTLRMGFLLSAFTGAAAAAEYLALAIFLLAKGDGTLPPLFHTAMFYIAKSAFLFLGGLVAGFVGLQIRRGLERTLQVVEEENRVRQMFGRHVSSAVVDRLLEAGASASASETRRVSILFLDIRGFTTFSEGRSPAEVVHFLNHFFDPMIETVSRHDGFINKFLGDGFMAVFGAPVAAERSAERAVRCAIELVSDVQRRVNAGQLPGTRIGIGIHSGEAVTGNVGSSTREEYTVIGDSVNVASRIEQMNKELGSILLISEDTYAEAILTAPELAATASPGGRLPVRGRTEPVRLFRFA